MSSSSTQTSRHEVAISALIYLMSSYRRTPCMRIALCIAGHLAYLSQHPDADPIIREICGDMVGDWRDAARGIAPSGTQQQPFSEFNLH